MKVQVLSDSGDLRDEFGKLFAWADRVQMAYAWATSSAGTLQHWRAMHMRKIERAIIGTQFAQTEPWALSALDEVKDRLRVAISSTGTFHPKLVIGWKGGRIRAIVGSSNLTGAAFSSNIELNLLLSGEANDPVAVGLAEFLDEAWEAGTELSAEWLDRYTEAWLKRPKFVGLVPHARLEVASIQSLDMSWPKYVELIANQEGRVLESGYKLSVSGPAPSYKVELDRTRGAFAQHAVFANMPVEQRKLIIGMGSLSSGLLGRMGAAGWAKQSVGSDPGRVGEYLDALPLHGAVSLENAFDLVSGLTTIRGISIGVASRVLAVKRPDIFVSVNNGSKRSLAKLLGRGSVNTAQRYKDLLEIVWNTEWHRSEAPLDETQRAIWDRRAALLDAALYEEV